MIHFDEDVVGADELKLIQTKKAIWEKLRARFGFDDVANPRALMGAQTATPSRLPVTHAPRTR